MTEFDEVDAYVAQIATLMSEDIKGALMKSDIQFDLTEAIGNEFTLKTDEAVIKSIGKKEHDNWEDFIDTIVNDIIVTDDEFKEDQQYRKGIPRMNTLYKEQLIEWIEDTKLRDPKNEDEAQRINSMNPEQKRIALTNIAQRIHEAKYYRHLLGLDRKSTQNISVFMRDVM